MSARTACYVLVLGMLILPGVAFAQDHVTIGGLAYVDYYYVLDSRDSARVDLNGFTYRRLFLTTDFKLSETITGRARLEANEETNSARGPLPFVKDLYLRWKGQSGHALWFGVMPPPAFAVSEEIWGYRALEKTTLDFYGIVSSRDFGVRADGPVVSSGKLRYAVMLANNSSTRVETDKYKRLYGQLEARPTENLSFTLGGDYAGYGDNGRKNGVTVNGFGGYRTKSFRFGVEAFLNRVTFEDDPDLDRTAVSVFGAVKLSDKVEATARVDRFHREQDNNEDYKETFIVGGIAYRPHERVRIIPNVWVVKPDEGDDMDVTGRFTLEFSF